MVSWLDDESFPSRFDDPDELDAFLSRPSRALAADLAAIDGDIFVLGVGGKIGPTLPRLARNAAPDKRVIGVARFSDAGLRESSKLVVSKPSPAIFWIALRWQHCRESATSYSWLAGNSARRPIRR